jgi:hypothetical protein
MKKSNYQEKHIPYEDIEKEFSCDVNLETILSEENKMALSGHTFLTYRNRNETNENLNRSKKFNKRFKRLNLTEYSIDQNLIDHNLKDQIVETTEDKETQNKINLTLLEKNEMKNFKQDFSKTPIEDCNSNNVFTGLLNLVVPSKIDF